MEQKTMKAAVLEGIGILNVKDVPVPVISDNDLLLKVDSCGICGSDLRIIYNGNSRINYPQILGHEITGTLAEVGERQKGRFEIGDKISLSADIPCGNCIFCSKGLMNHCDKNIAFGYEYPGGFAEYVKLDKRIIDHGPFYVLPKDNFNLEQVAMAEPLACCINGLELCRVKKDDNVLIYGAGPIGSILTRLARAYFASSVVVCDIDQGRLNASMVAGADRYIKSSDDALKKAMGDFTNGIGFDAVITACPSIEAQESALKYVRPRGVINFFGGLPQGSKNLSLSSNLLHYKEISIFGSHGSTPLNHLKAVSMLLSRDIVLEDLISRTFKLDDIGLAISEAVSNKSNLKIIIKP